MTSDPAILKRRAKRFRRDRMFVAVCVGAAGMSLVILATLLTAITVQALSRNKEIIQVLQTPTPQAFTDWAQIDFEVLSAHPRHDWDGLAELEEVDWVSLAEQQQLTTAADIANVDWEKVKDDQDIRWRRGDLRDLEAIDWAQVMPILGQGGVEAWWDGYAPDVFLSGPTSRWPARAGIYPAFWGSLLICLVCALTAVPIGVATAIGLEEFRVKRGVLGKVHAFVQLNITNLAGVPSIVYGILGLTAIVGMFGLLGKSAEPAWELGTPENWYYLRLPFGRGVLAGGLTLMLVVLPIIIISAQESLRAVPNSLRQGALALGCTRWQMVWRMTLPAAVPGIMTGTILALSRAIGEAAPILVIAGIVYITFTPEHLMDDFTVMPLQIFDWAGRPQAEFHRVAAAAIVVLLALLLSFNAIAVFIRYKFQRPMS